MPTTDTEQTFASTYKDDYDKTKNYHRVLFNSGKALQARELTQMQTIIQQELSQLSYQPELQNQLELSRI